MTTLTEQRVAAGAAWIDEVHPGWERKIDLATMQLSDEQLCVLGQVVGRGVEVVARFNPFSVGLNPDACSAGYALAHQWMVDHGFALDSVTDASPRWLSLEQAWAALVKERFDSGLLSDEVGS